MRCTLMGWASLELEHEGASLVIDLLADPGAVYAALAEAARDVVLPEVIAPRPRTAAAGLVTHLHRDHADAAALESALAPNAGLFGPLAEPRGSAASDTALLQARRELEALGLSLSELRPWEQISVGPFEITALPAADGTGDPQVSWAVAAGGKRVLHCGDTIFHGWWWRAAEVAGPFDVAFLPINGAQLNFPWRQPPSPLPGVMTPEQAVQAARALGARRAVPMHFGAYDLEPYYRSIPDARERFLSAASSAGLDAVLLETGQSLEL